MFTASSSIIIVLLGLPVLVLQAVLRVDKKIRESC